MKSLTWKSLTMAAGLACLMSPAAWAQAQVEEEVEVFGAADHVIGTPPVATWVGHAEGFPGDPPSSHWIGVACRPAESVLHKQLKIEGGLVVEDVTPDSPAAKAGIEQDDILLAVNDIELSDQGQLMKFLNGNKEKEVKLKYLHAGETKTAKLTPAERPVDHLKFFAVPAGPDGVFEFKLPEGEGKDAAAWKEWAEKLAKEAPEKGEPLKMRFFHPGVMLGDDEHIQLELVLGDLPKDLKVLINKEGDGPTKIHVERGDEKWDVTEKDLDKLPEDVRMHVKKFLGQPHAFGIRLAKPKVVPFEGAPVRGIRIAPPAVPAEGRPVRVEARAIQLGGGPIEKQLGEINSRLEKIEKVLEKLADEKE